MSVIIRDREMPTACEYCPLCRYYPESKRVWCNGTNRILKNVWENADWTHLGVKKPDWCPLVEIPKNARLIDANEVEEKISIGLQEPDYQHDGETWIVGLIMARDYLDDVSTIFEEGNE